MSNNKKKARGYTLKALKEVSSIALRANKKVYISYILLSIIISFNTFVLLASTEYITNSAYNLFTKKVEFNTVIIGISLFTAAILLFMVLDIIKKMAENRLMLDIIYYFEKNLNSKLSGIKWEYYESHDIYLKIHEVRSKTPETIKNMIGSITVYITAIPLTAIFAYYLLQINAFAVIIYVIMVLIFNRASGKMYDKLGLLWNEIQPYTQKQNYFFGMSGDKTTHQEFKFNRLYDYCSRKWSDLYDSEYKLKLKIFRNYEITIQTARIIFNIPYISMLIFVAYEIAMGKHEIGFLFMTNTLLNNIINMVLNIQSNITENSVDSRFIKAYNDICSLENAPIYKNAASSCDIDINNLTYTYPQSEYKALDKLSFKIKNGEKIAVVGVNGSGKTTFTNILMSLTDKFTGSITCGGKVCPKFLISCILQDFAQYQMTVKENIEVGNTNKDFSDDEIIDLLNKVGLKENVLALEKGIYTPLGQLEKGIELSKGQWQRLAIARLLANPDASIWVLDEPTAYLDPLSEIEIYNMIYQFAENRTVFFISHRLGFAKKADRIILFEKGHIAEQGTHDELVKSGGLYAQMYKGQESWYAV